MSRSSRLWSAPTTRRWIGWAALAGAFILVNFHRVSTGVLADTLASEFETTGPAGLLHAAFFYVYAPMQLFAGVLTDRMGRAASPPSAPP